MLMAVTKNKDEGRYEAGNAEEDNGDGIKDKNGDDDNTDDDGDHVGDDADDCDAVAADDKADAHDQRS